jgi:hypothetical protein
MILYLVGSFENCNRVLEVILKKLNYATVLLTVRYHDQNIQEEKKSRYFMHVRNMLPSRTRSAQNVNV